MLESWPVVVAYLFYRLPSVLMPYLAVDEIQCDNVEASQQSNKQIKNTNQYKNNDIYRKRT